MTQYHAVMIDETGCEFGVDFEAQSRDEAYDYLDEQYPESRVVQLESPEDTRKRQEDMYHRINAEMDDDYYDYEADY